MSRDQGDGSGGKRSPVQTQTPEFRSTASTLEKGNETKNKKAGQGGWSCINILLTPGTNRGLLELAGKST